MPQKNSIFPTIVGYGFFIIVSTFILSTNVNADKQRANDEYARGYQKFKQEKWKIAADHFLKSYREEEHSLSALMLAGSSYYLGDAQKTRDYARIALEVGPPLKSQQKEWAQQLFRVANHFIENPGTTNLEAKADDPNRMGSVVPSVPDHKSNLKFPPAPTGSQIRARYKSSQCLHKKNNNWDNGNPVHLWSCAAGSDAMKKWNYDLKTGYIRSANNPRMCWQKKKGIWANGNPIHLWNCDAGVLANKTWTYEANSGLIRARKNRDKCIHKKNGGFGNGNPVHLWDCKAGKHEFKSWRLQ
jgi:hypothetical protein